MLRMIQSTSSARARSYYSSADYYSQGQELQGAWHGKGAQRLGLTGAVRPQDWEALCDFRNPVTGLPLTQRQKDNRSVGYDFNFHAPKSVSLLYSLSEDQRILEAFQDAVGRTMQDMEEEMQTRVRTGGMNQDRTTGNMLWGEFIHFTARPVNSVPDPHLHAHCFVFNATYDDQEKRWKAGQFRGLKRDAPYFEAVFHSRLSENLAGLGLPIERTRTGWEIGGLSESMLKKFSRRTAVIEQAAQEKGITDGAAKDQLGAATRERKQKELTMDQLRAEWKSRLTPDEEGSIKQAGAGLDGRSPGIPRVKDGPEMERAARNAVRNAADHYLERSSVIPARRIMAEAMKRSVGTTSVPAIQRAFEEEGYLTAERDGQRLATTREVLAEEKKMVEFARDGRGACVPMGGSRDHVFRRKNLGEGQRRAVEHVLKSRDRVTLIRGAAGVGKTTMMQEAVEGIEANGKEVFAFAPSADASRGVLRNEGFAEADTVARLLIDTELQERVRGQVVWIDEAGQLGTKTMGRVFSLARELDARVVLSGDVRQHGSVERGAALRLLEDEAGLRPAEITEIRRQKGSYKLAVEALSEGNVDLGFKRLDELGWVREVAAPERYQTLADEYINTVKEGKTALVVSPTHVEGDRITQTVREQLKKSGAIGKDERVIPTFIDAQFTESQRRDPCNYTAGDTVVFHQNARGGIRRGQRVQVGKEPIPLGEADKFQVFRSHELALAPGDMVRITRNGATADGVHRLNNGSMYTLRNFNEKGDLVLNNGWTVSRDYGHLSYGYVVTSYASQGKTVDRVFIGQSSDSFGASSREQFYVSASRAREKAVVFTDDKVSLLDAVNRSDERISATELVAQSRRRERACTLARQRYAPPRSNDNTRRPSQQRDQLRERELERA